MGQSEEDRKNIIILQDSLDKLNEKIKMYKRQLEEQESISNSNIMRVKKFQRELESAENRAEEAESTLNQFRSRERECLRPPLLAARNLRTCRRPRWWSRRPSTRSTSAPPPWRCPPPLPLTQVISVLGLWLAQCPTPGPAPLLGRDPLTGGPAWQGLDPWLGLPPLSVTRHPTPLRLVLFSTISAGLNNLYH